MPSDKLTPDEDQRRLDDADQARREEEIERISEALEIMKAERIRRAEGK